MSQPTSLDAEAGAALATYADIAHASYADALQEARTLKSTLGALLERPSAATLDDARKQWLRARAPYRQTEVFRFYGGPIDELEPLINTWPIDESYVEAGTSAPTPGIIENSTRYPDLSSTLLAELNVKEGETSVSTGYHVIEFLLWGKDASLEGPGERPYSDYVAEGATEADAPVIARRRRYLALAAELLVRHLEQIDAAWDPKQGDNYRARLLALPHREALGLVVQGMGALSGPELSGERLTVAYETKDQENEHSCFSDSTSDDIVGNALGIQNVCEGRYVRISGSVVSGPGICALIGALAQPLGRELSRQIAASVGAARTIPAPFDRAIVAPSDAPARRAVLAAITALTAQADTLATIASRLRLGADKSARAIR